MFDPPKNPFGFKLTLAGVPVTVAASSLVVPALIAIWFTDPLWALGAAAVVFGSVLIHELGHAMVFRAYGIRSRIVLHAMGGVTLGDRAVDRRGGRILVSLAGPAAEMVLLGLPAIWAYQNMDLSSEGQLFLQVAVLVTVGWSVFNLLPVLPLDGGHVVEELLGTVTRGGGFVASRVLSIVVAAAVAVVAGLAGWLLVAAFMLGLAWESVRDLRHRRSQRQFTALIPANDAYKAGRSADALAQIRPLLARRGLGPEAKAAAVSLAAWAALADDDIEAARAVVAHQPGGHDLNGHLRALLVERDRSEQLNATVDAWLETSSLDPAVYVRWIDRLGLTGALVERMGASRADAAVQATLQLQEVLFRGGRFDDSARLGEIRLRTGIDGSKDLAWVLAYNIACSYGRAGRAGEGLRWLATAGNFGIPDPAIVDSDPDLAGVRSLGGYRSVRRALRPAPPSS